MINEIKSCFIHGDFTGESCPLCQLRCTPDARLIAAAPDMAREIASFLKAYDLIRAGNIADVAFVVQVHLPKFRAALAGATGAKVPA